MPARYFPKSFDSGNAHLININTFAATIPLQLQSVISNLIVVMLLKYSGLAKIPALFFRFDLLIINIL